MLPIYDRRLYLIDRVSPRREDINCARNLFNLSHSVRHSYLLCHLLSAALTVSLTYCRAALTVKPLVFKDPLTSSSLLKLGQTVDLITIFAICCSPTISTYVDRINLTKLYFPSLFFHLLFFHIIENLINHCDSDNMHNEQDSEFLI